MKKVHTFFLLIFTLLLLPSFGYGQRSKVISSYQLIETGKYKDAKELIEEAIKEKGTKEWYRTWHTRGFLCQKAYEDGIKEKEEEKYHLYPNQLFVAWESYQKAISLDKRGRLNDPLAPALVRLANDFQVLGNNSFTQQDYKTALNAFSSAIEISRDPILAVETDNNLIYNAALSAYECSAWDTAIEFLVTLNTDNYSPNAAHLLYEVYLKKSDTTQAKLALQEGISQYEENEDLILLLTDLYIKTGELDSAINLLKQAADNQPDQYIYPYTMGLVYQKSEKYKEAILNYTKATDLNPGKISSYSNIGACYYNQGVAINEAARNITNSRLYRMEKDKAADLFSSAAEWYEQALRKNPEESSIISRLIELYKFLGLKEKAEKLENMPENNAQ